MDKKLQKGIIAVLIANIINVFFSLSTNFLLPAYLSIESYASIKEFQLYVSYAGLFHFGFVDGIYLKYGGKNLGKRLGSSFYTDLSTMRIFQIAVTIVVLMISIISNERLLMFFAVSILPQNITNYFKFLYQATGEFNLYGKIMNLITISTFVLNITLLFIVKTDNEIWYILGYDILFVLIWGILESHFYRNHERKKGKFSYFALYENIKSGFLLTLGNLASVFLTSMDRWFVKILMSTVDFAQYSFAVSVENFLNLAITPVTTTLYNYFCRENDEETHAKIYRFVIVFATILPAAAFPVQFILDIFLKKYSDSAQVVFLLFSAQMFYVVIKAVYVNLYKVQRKQKTYFIKLVTILVLGFAFNCCCYAIMKNKEAFAVGTLLAAIVWFWLSATDFKYLKQNITVYIYLFTELLLFLLTGFYLTPVIGFIIYIILTISLCAIFMNQTFRELVTYGKKLLLRDKLEVGK